MGAGSDLGRAAGGDRGSRGEVRPLSVAPMMDRTDRHFRFLVRLLTRRTLVYTEMVPAAALIHGDRRRLLEHRDQERPLALQLGGSDPAGLARCARWAEESGFDEVNLNVGCPSPKVREGRFGACLMLEPERVGEAVAAMRAAVSLPVTVKHRLGVDDRDRYEDLARFVEVVAASGCDRFIVHARKAHLRGLNPRQNRSVPPLRHEWVHRLKADFPLLRIETNGGLRSWPAILRHLKRLDGVMIGRAAWDRPYLLAEADARVFGDPSSPVSRTSVLDAWEAYAAEEEARGVPPARLVAPVLNLFSGEPGARRWRRLLTEPADRAACERLRWAREAVLCAQPA